MIKIKIKELLEKNNMNQTQLANITNIRPNTISAYYHGTMQRIDVDHINILCEVFKVKDIRDLIEYQSDEPELIIALTPLVALESTIQQVLSQYKLGISRKQLDSHQNFIYNLFLEFFQYLSNINYDKNIKSHKEIYEEKLALLFFTCIKYGLITNNEFITNILLKIQSLNQ